MNMKIPTDLKSLKIRGELFEPSAGIWLEIWIELNERYEINDAYIIGVREDFHRVVFSDNAWQMITEYYHFNPAGKAKLQQAAEDALTVHCERRSLAV